MTKEETILQKIAAMRVAKEKSTNKELSASLDKKLKTLTEKAKGMGIPASKIKGETAKKAKKMKEDPSAFEKYIEELKKKPDFKFLSRMSTEDIRRDIMRKAKPVGWRFKGKNNVKKPTAKQVREGRKRGSVYFENRMNRADRNRTIRLEKGGVIDRLVIDNLEHALSLKKIGEKKNVIRTIRDVNADQIGGTEGNILKANMDAALNSRTMKDIDHHLNASINLFKDQLAKGGSTELYAVVAEKDGYWIVLTHPVSKKKAEQYAKDAKVLEGETVSVKSMKAINAKVRKVMKDGGVVDSGSVDLFAWSEMQPKELREITRKMDEKYIHDGLEYKDLEDFQKQTEKLGYTFDYDLSAEPYGLRKIGTPLKSLEGFEDFEKGGAIEALKQELKLIENVSGEGAEQMRKQIKDRIAQMEEKQASASSKKGSELTIEEYDTFYDHGVYARKDSKTGKGMNEGYIFHDGDMYFANKEDALEQAKKDGYDSLQESYDDENHYYTEWGDMPIHDEGEYYTEDGKHVELMKKGGFIEKVKAGAKKAKAAAKGQAKRVRKSTATKVLRDTSKKTSGKDRATVLDAIDVVEDKYAKGGGFTYGRYRILGQWGDRMPNLYAKTNNKAEIPKIVEEARKDFAELTGRDDVEVFVTDDVNDERLWHYSKGGSTYARGGEIEVDKSTWESVPDYGIENYRVLANNRIIDEVNSRIRAVELAQSRVGLYDEDIATVVDSYGNTWYIIYGDGRENYFIPPYEYAKGGSTYAGGGEIDGKRYALNTRLKEYNWRVPTEDAKANVIRDIFLENKGRLDKKKWDYTIEKNPTWEDVWEEFKTDMEVEVKDGKYVNPYQTHLFSKGGSTYSGGGEVKEQADQFQEYLEGYEGVVDVDYEQGKNVKGEIVYRVFSHDTELLEQIKYDDFDNYGEILPYHGVDSYLKASKFFSESGSTYARGGGVRDIDDNYWYIRTMIQKLQRNLDEDVMSTERTEETMREIEELKKELMDKYARRFSEGGAIVYEVKFQDTTGTEIIETVTAESMSEAERKAWEKTGLEKESVTDDGDRVGFTASVVRMEKGGSTDLSDFEAIFKGKKIQIQAKDLWGAKQEAIKQLKVPKSKQGLLSVYSLKSKAQGDFMFMERGGALEPNAYYFFDGNEQRTFSTFEEARREAVRANESMIRDDLGGKYYLTDSQGNYVGVLKRSQLIDMVRHHERGLPPHGDKYHLRYAGKTFFGNDTSEVVDQAAEHAEYIGVTVYHDMERGGSTYAGGGEIRSAVRWAKGDIIENDYRDISEVNIMERFDDSSSQLYKVRQKLGIHDEDEWRDIYEMAFDDRENAYGIPSEYEKYVEESVFGSNTYAKGGSTDDRWLQAADAEMEEKGTVGAFTKQAARHGMNPVDFAKEVLANPDDYSERTRRRAQFVKNVNPEKFATGGSIGSPKSMWNSWSVGQRHSFIEDNSEAIFNGREDSSASISMALYSYDMIPDHVQRIFAERMAQGAPYYKEGGAMPNVQPMGVWFRWSLDERRAFLKSIDMNPKLASKQYNEVPAFVRKELYKYIHAKFEKGGDLSAFKHKIGQEGMFEGGEYEVLGISVGNDSYRIGHAGEIFGTDDIIDVPRTKFESSFRAFMN